GLALVSSGGCRFPLGGDSRLASDEVVPPEALARVHDATHSVNTNVIDGLARGHRRARVYPGACGYERGTIRPLRTGETVAPVAWFDEPGAWRALARPKGSEGCLAGESAGRDDDTCEREYGLQLFPTVKTNVAARDD